MTVAATAIGATVAASMSDGSNPARVSVLALSTTDSRVVFETTVNLSGGRVLLAAELRNAGGVTRPAYFYRDDLDVGGRTMTIPAGTPVNVQVPTSPDCGELAAAEPLLLVRSERADGTITTDTFEVSNPDEVAEAVRDWCTGGLKAQQSRSAWYPDSKQAEVTLLVTNPEPVPVTVTFDGSTSSDGARWLPTSATLPPGATPAEFVLRADDVRCAIVDPSFWSDQHLTVTGGSPDPQVLRLELGGC